MTALKAFMAVCCQTVSLELPLSSNASLKARYNTQSDCGLEIYVAIHHQISF